MINTFTLKKTPTIQACQWNGSNIKEMDTFLNGSGYCKGQYVEVGAVVNGQPTLRNARVGSYVIKDALGNYSVLYAEELFEQYVLSD
ncbi:hypothetical protein fHeYen902_256 [Yersinia phage fHe-Yen9-02]|nr:hypothetical protein fHeYen902_256 [Yersinia phage fHe-Yen9-02]